jgi:hypothetical protein
LVAQGIQASLLRRDLHSLPGSCGVRKTMKAPETNLPANNPFHGWKKTILHELSLGGGESPCPFCRVPRVRRSDYIRCCHCMVNWLDGEGLEKDPRIERFNKFLADTRAASTKPPKKDDK